MKFVKLQVLVDFLNQLFKQDMCMLLNLLCLELCMEKQESMF